MQTPPLQAAQNSNSMIKPIEMAPKNQMSAVDAKAVASPTPVIAGAPTQTRQADSVELSNKENKKLDKSVIFAFIVGGLVACISALKGKKPPQT